MISHDRCFIFEQRSGKQYYSKCIKSLCREVRGMDGWFNKSKYVFLRSKKQVEKGVWCDTHHRDMSLHVR